MQEIEASGQALPGVRDGELAGLREDRVPFDGRLDEPTLLTILFEMRHQRSPFGRRQHGAPYQQFEGVSQFKTVQGREGDRLLSLQGLSSSS